MNTITIKKFLENEKSAKIMIRNAMREDVIYFDKSDSCWYGYFTTNKGNLEIINPMEIERINKEEFSVILESRLTDKMLISLAYLLGYELDYDPDEYMNDRYDLSLEDQNIISDMMDIYADGLYFYSTYFQDDVEEMYDKICEELENNQ